MDARCKQAQLNFFPPANIFPHALHLLPMNSSPSASDTPLRLARLADILSGYTQQPVAALPPEILEAVEFQELARGATLMRAGAPSDAIYFVLTGKLSAYTTDSTGDLKKVGEVGAGESLGETGVLTGDPRNATLVAGRDCVLAKYDQATFQRLLVKHPGVLQKLMRLVVQRARNEDRYRRTKKRITNLALLPVGIGPDQFRKVAEELAAALGQIGKTVMLSSPSVDARCGQPGLAQVTESDPSGASLHLFLEDQEGSHRFCLYLPDREATAWSQRCLRQSDLVLLLAEAGSDPRPGALERELVAPEKHLTEGQRVLLLVHPPGTSAPQGTARWYTGRTLDDHFHLRWERTQDFRRVARIISGNANALILSGGGPRALSQIGVIRALHEAGVPIDLVGGVSMGATLAAAVAAQKSPAEILEVAQNLIRSNPFTDYTLPFVSILKGRKLERILRELYPMDLEDLWLNFVCHAADLSDNRIAVYRRGIAWKALRASVSIPGLFPPVLENRSVYVDGAVLNNHPVDILRELYDGKMILVDAAIKDNYYAQNDDIPRTRSILLRKLVPFLKPQPYPSLLDIMGLTMSLGGNFVRKDRHQEADLLLEPEVTALRYLDLKNVDKYEIAGYEYTRGVLQGIDLSAWSVPLQ